MYDFEAMSPMVRRAYEIAREAHRGQKDKAGEDYILHPMTVASFLEKEEEIVVALLHDTVEDTSVTLEDLRKVFSEEITDALSLMTHDKSTPYKEYVIRIKGNPISRSVKLADLRHNMDLSRLSVVDEAAQWRIKYKYDPARKFLMGEISEEEYRRL